jgi:thymidylate synthase
MKAKYHPEYQYLNLLKYILKNGEWQTDRGTGVRTFSVFGPQMRFDLSKGFPLLTTKKVFWKGILHELYWFMSGQSNIKYLVDRDVHIWDNYPYKIYKKKHKTNGKKMLTKDGFIDKIKKDKKFAKKWGELPQIYGELWRRWPAKDGRKIDQLSWVIQELRDDPNAHNTLVSSWNPEYLYTMAPKGKGAVYPICHNMYQINIKKGKVCMHLYQRSADIFLGVPFNIASYALLTMIIAQILGRKPGEFVHTFGDTHIYENHFKAVKEQLKRRPRPFPKVLFTKKFKSLKEFKPEYVVLEGYNPHPSLKAELTVAGGYYEGKKKRK